MKQNNRQNAELADAVREIAKVLAQQEQERRQADARIQWAAKLQEAGNLTLVGTVLAQVFSGNFNSDIAKVGVLLFSGSYLFAYWMMKGGGRS